MDSGKVDNQLNLSLETPEAQREKTLDLNVGFDPEDRLWELIVKFNGSLSEIAETLGFTYVELLNGYAVITIPQNKVDALSAFDEIEFIDKPKRINFEVMAGKSASCITPVQTPQFNLFGEGTLIAVIDSGIDYSHPDFRNPDGTTRILYLWDQVINSREEGLGPPEGFTTGTLYTRERINEALQKRNPAERLMIVPSVDLSGHGTHVTSIAAGTGRASDGRYRGVAPESELIIVKLGSSISGSYPRTTQLMTAVDFAVRKALELKKPMAINISFGNNYGSHDGNSLLENYLNDISDIWKLSVVVGTGNEGAGRSHTGGILSGNQSQIVELAIAEGESTINIQIWKNYYDVFDVSIIHPNGTVVGPIPTILGKQQFRIGQTDILLYYGDPQPENRAQEIYFDLIPRNTFIDSGIWKIELTPREIVVGNFDLWLPTGSLIGPQTGFLLPSPATTLTIPSGARRAISVGAYDSNTDSIAPFSGRGYTRNDTEVKPDIVAPGVNITAASPGGGYTMKSGTSMATPFVTGSAALLMEWGIVNGNDPFLYGEKLKAYLIRGARKLPGYTEWPNPQVGFGALCVRDSIPV